MCIFLHFVTFELEKSQRLSDSRSVTYETDMQGLHFSLIFWILCCTLECCKSL